VIGEKENPFKYYFGEKHPDLFIRGRNDRLIDIIEKAKKDYGINIDSSTGIGEALIIEPTSGTGEAIKINEKKDGISK